jgi:hypothetical protein
MHFPPQNSSCLAEIGVLGPNFDIQSNTAPWAATCRDSCARRKLLLTMYMSLYAFRKSKMTSTLNQDFDNYHSMHGAFFAQEGLKCHHPMVFEYYNSTIKNRVPTLNANLCAYCAGSSGGDGVVDELLCVEWKTRSTCVHIMLRRGGNFPYSKLEKK